MLEAAPQAHYALRTGCLRPYAHVWMPLEIRCVCGAASRDSDEAEWDTGDA